MADNFTDCGKSQTNNEATGLELVTPDLELNLEDLCFSKRNRDACSEGDLLARLIGNASTGIKPPAATDHEIVDLEQLTAENIMHMSLNQLQASIPPIRDVLSAHATGGGKNLFVAGAELGNPDSPFMNADSLYRPAPELIKELLGDNVTADDLTPGIKASSLDRHFENRVPGFPFNSENESAPKNSRERYQEFLMQVVALTANPQQRLEYERLLQIEKTNLLDPNMREVDSLRALLKAPEHKLTTEQLAIFNNQKELLQQVLTMDKVLAQYGKLHKMYLDNDWREDSHWFGLDDNKFLTDLKTRNTKVVSDFDKFRALATIDRMRAAQPETLAQDVDVDKLPPEQARFRCEIEQQERDLRDQLVERVRGSIKQLHIMFDKQQSKQGVVSDSADWFIGRTGTPGGWGGVLMDSSATSDQTRLQMETARVSTQNVLNLTYLKGTNEEFRKAYSERTIKLSEDLNAALSTLQKYSDAHNGRVEAVSNIAQGLAALGATVACGFATPETFGGSLAAIPIVAPMAAAAAGKVSTKLLENQTADNGDPYTLPNVTLDAGLAAVTSLPIMPGAKLAAPLLTYEAAATSAKQISLAGFSQSAKVAGIHALGHSIEGSVDGAITAAVSAPFQGLDPVEAVAIGFTSGAIFNPILGLPLGALSKRARVQLPDSPGAAEIGPITRTPAATFQPSPLKTLKPDSAFSQTSRPRLGTHFANGTGGNRADSNILPTAAMRTRIDATHDIGAELKNALKECIDTRSNAGLKIVDMTLRMTPGERARAEIKNAFMSNEPTDIIQVRIDLARAYGRPQTDAIAGVPSCSRAQIAAIAGNPSREELSTMITMLRPDPMIVDSILSDLAAAAVSGEQLKTIKMASMLGIIADAEDLKSLFSGDARTKSILLELVSNRVEEVRRQTAGAAATFNFADLKRNVDALAPLISKGWVPEEGFAKLLRSNRREDIEFIKTLKLKYLAAEPYQVDIVRHDGQRIVEGTNPKGLLRECDEQRQALAVLRVKSPVDSLRDRLGAITAEDTREDAIHALNKLISIEIPAQAKRSNGQPVTARLLERRLRDIEFAAKDTSLTPEQLDRVLRNEILLHAYRKASEQNRQDIMKLIAEGKVYAFSHGSRSNHVDKMVSAPEESITPNSGKHGGRFFCADDVPTALFYAKGDSDISGDREPALIGFVLPADTYKKLSPDESNPVLRDKLFSQTIFEPAQVNTLTKSAFFFRLDPE